jgi:hypothetical protein
MFNVKIDNNKAWLIERETLTAYSQGSELVQIFLDFGPEWSTLSKIGVFRAYETQIDVAISSTTVTIPPQALLKDGVHLLFGVYGMNADGTVIIPTIWADLGIIQPAPNFTDAENWVYPPPELCAQIAALAKAAQEAAEAAARGVHAAGIDFFVNGVTEVSGVVQYDSDYDVGHLIMTVSTGGISTNSDMGPVSAYAAVCATGWVGDYDDFVQMLLANETTAAAAQAALDAVAGVESTANSASSAAASAVSTANAASSNATNAAAAASAASNAVAAKQAQHKKVQVVLASGVTTWADQSAEGVTATNTVIYGPDPSSFDEASSCQIKMTAQGNGTVSFSAAAAPSSAITMNLAIFD